MRSQRLPTITENSPLVEVLQTQKSVIYSTVSDAYLRNAALDENQYNQLKQVNMTSFLITPIIIHHKVKGFISLTSAESDIQYGPITQHMLEELADRIALAIQNAQLYKELQRQEAQFQALRQANIIGVLHARHTGEVLDANKAYLDMIGYTRKELLQNQINWRDITPEAYLDTDKKKVVELEQKGVAEPWEKELIRKDGTRVPIIIGAVSLNHNTENIAFVLDITERKELEKRKDEFLGIASHELKTPLSSIKGYTQILERIIVQMGDEKLKTYLRKTNTYIDRLNSLIADLLDVSKIQAGKLQFNYQQFSFQELVEDSVESMQHTYPTQVVHIEGSIPDLVTADRHRLEQVFSNLLTNAIKYSKKDQKVIVHLKKDAEMIHVAVQDFGVGIGKNDAKKIFERFYRAKSIEKHYSGLGIGLYISHEIIARHGGRMWVESEVGKGSTFYFTVPIGGVRGWRLEIRKGRR
jgi:PAS domain S-box-containing protein